MEKILVVLVKIISSLSPRDWLLNLIIFGPPGAGKGTQSKYIANKYNLYQLSTGELLRNEIKNKTELGSKISAIINSGELVSDEINSRSGN